MILFDGFYYRPNGAALTFRECLAPDEAPRQRLRPGLDRPSTRQRSIAYLWPWTP